MKPLGEAWFTNRCPIVIKYSLFLKCQLDWGHLVKTAGAFETINDSISTLAAVDNVKATGETATVKIIDVASQQMIADLDVRF